MKTNKAYLFLLPGAILFLTFSVYPIFKALQMSFFDWSIFGRSSFVGWQNYIKALTDPDFHLAMRNTIYYGLVTVPGQMIIAMIVAVLLDRKLKGRVIYRALYFLPVVTSWVVVSFIFKYLYNQQGLSNYILNDLLHFIPENISWLTNPKTALWAIMILGIWKGIGWTMVIYLGGLAGIPRELYEAAKVDGANVWQQFWRITLPLLRPTITFVLIMLAIGSFNVFISVYIMTQGGPLGQTEVALTYMYRHAFDYLELGYGAAVSYILAIIIFIVSIIQYKFLRVPTEF
ncbi:MAG TPA: sugar ABC transporter permease [Candidatus Atribacteria bacterium]|nr:MAG: sugar ABC transporter permease [Candidatus Nealsonbacteria bacterium]HDK28094.1 sugar ABC transporter permease [Candidatus Atribacteria bacterium]